MTAVLFVSNGHGEAAIAERIAVELAALLPALRLDHLALVGDVPSESLRDVGPRAAMPSGGLIAMGNVRNIARDVRAGLLGLTLAQRRFLRNVRGEYAATVAVGDAFALLMALQARAPSVFVGTAKSVNVAPYGVFEERLLRRAAARFVRDAPTAERLELHGLHVEAPANVIADLFATPDDARAERAVEGFSPAIALFPGSRSGAYASAAFLLEVARRVAEAQPGVGAVLSVARGLDAQDFEAIASRSGWKVAATAREAIPFELSAGGRIGARAWRGAIGPLLRRVALVLGQAGTANEAAAAAGVPVVAFEPPGRDSGWYRKRQSGLLGDAMTVLPAESESAAIGVLALLDDPARRARMAAAGRARIGEPGAARRVAERIAGVVAAAQC
jgi:uncharacterized protein (TIGR03492 family)